jgi:hypothetical protein
LRGRALRVARWKARAGRGPREEDMTARRLQIIRETAYHEAGHAVAAWNYGVRFKHVTIIAEEDSFGHLMHSPPKWFHPDYDSSDRMAMRAQRYIIISFAGQLAQAKFRGKHPRWGMGSDNRNAVNMAFYMCGSEKTVDAYLRSCWSASNDLVNVRWREIKVVAKALLARNILKYEDVLEVISPGSKALRASLGRRVRKSGTINSV